jgi:hypothetical protein
MRRITTAQLATLTDQLSARDRAILADLERVRVLTGAQLQRLHFDPLSHNSRARDRRRILRRLTDLDLVATLDRRIGGTPQAPPDTFTPSPQPGNASKHSGADKHSPSDCDALALPANRFSVTP